MAFLRTLVIALITHARIIYICCYTLQIFSINQRILTTLRNMYLRWNQIAKFTRIIVLWDWSLQNMIKRTSFSHCLCCCRNTRPKTANFICITYGDKRPFSRTFPLLLPYLFTLQTQHLCQVWAKSVIWAVSPPTWFCLVSSKTEM